MKSPESIVADFRRRARAQSNLAGVNQAVLDQYEGRVRVNIDELDESEDAAVANLLTQAVDQTGARIASTEPQTHFYPDRPGTKSAEERARQRREAIIGLRAANQTKIKRRQRARWLIAYGQGPVVLRPWRGSVVWQPRSPLATYPAPMSEPDQMIPDDCMILHAQTWWWLHSRFPEQAAQLKRGKDTADDDEFMILEHVDGDAWTLIALARTPDAVTSTTGAMQRGKTPVIDRVTTSAFTVDANRGTESFVVLHRAPNMARLFGQPVCPVVIPSRIGLEGPLGQFNQMVALFRKRAKMMAIEEDAIIESIYPQQWLEAVDPNLPAEVIVTPDPRVGRLGETRNGRINTVNVQPGFQTYQTIDRYERAERISSGMPSDFGAESGTNIRTARRGEQLLESAISFPIQEAQELLALADMYENQIAVAILKGHYGSKAQSFGAAWRGRGPSEWVPSKLFPNDESLVHDVKYPFPGSDMNGLTIRNGQKVSLKLTSLQSARENDPEIDDPELERDRITAEALEAAQLASLQQQAAQGAIPPADLSRIAQLVTTDRLELFEAIAKVQQETQERQAQQAPAGSPETQPGLAQPGAGAEAQPSLGGSTLEQMASRFGALRLAQEAMPQERAQEAAGVAGAAGR